MNTLLEFLYSVKAVEYLIAIGFVAAFVVYWQILNAGTEAEGLDRGQHEQPAREDKAA